MGRGVALAVQAPAPLVAVEVVGRRGDGVPRLEPVLGGGREEARVVGHLVTARLERGPGRLARLPPPVPPARPNEAARAGEAGGPGGGGGGGRGAGAGR